MRRLKKILPLLLLLGGCLTMAVAETIAAADVPAAAVAPVADAPAAPVAAVAAAPAADAPEAAPVATIDSGDTAWVMMAAALVLLMTPGLAFFYGGLVRRKNVLDILTQCFAVICVISLQWVLFGYSLAFHPGEGFWGGFGWAGLAGVGQAPNTDYAATIPHLVFMAFQMMFAVITPALIIGAFAERMRFAAFLVFSVLWSTFIYDPVCHWVWGIGGWLRVDGTLDFAGGTVVHILAGSAALAAALMVGRRRKLKGAIPPHSLPFSALGAGLLWFGWFGFNAGSALGANGLAAQAFVTTNTATAAAGLTYMLIEWYRHGKPTLFGTITGAVAGLVAITPACGFVGPGGAILIGLAAGFLCLWAVVVLKSKFGYDDSLDVFGVHGVGGILGALLTGIFVNPALGGTGVTDYLAAGTTVATAAYSFGTQMYAQVMAVIIAVIWTSVVSIVALLICKAVFGLRVKEQEEREGLDLVDHGERAYN
jgi:Amt family ammonium transporter